MDTILKVDQGGRNHVYERIPQMIISKLFISSIDVNECSSPITNPCSERQKCLNLRGGYFCYCRSGYLTIDNECVG